MNYLYIRVYRTMAKYFCIKKFDLIKYFLRIDYRTNGLSQAASDFYTYKNSTIQMLSVNWKSREIFACMSKREKRDTNRDIKLHQLRNLEKVRLVITEDSIGDHKREATHDIVLRHWLAWWSWRIYLTRISLSPRSATWDNYAYMDRNVPGSILEIGYLI